MYYSKKIVCKYLTPFIALKTSIYLLLQLSLKNPAIKNGVTLKKKPTAENLWN